MARWLAGEPLGTAGVAALTPKFVDARIAT
jgi:hypothetical protein